MKLGYDSWMKGLKLSELIHRAVFKTVVQRSTVAAYNLSKFLSKHYNSQHGLYTKKIVRSNSYTVEVSERFRK